MFANSSRRSVGYVIAAALIAALPFVSPNSFYVNLAQEVVLLTIAGIGLNLLLGLSGQISLGQAGFFAVGAYASGLMAQRLGWPLALTIPVAVLCAGVTGLLVGLVGLRARTHYLAMVTLAFGFIIGILAQRWVGVTGGAMGLMGMPQLNWGDGGNGPRNFFWTSAAILLVIQVLSDYMMQSHAGRVLRTISESESFAATVGIQAPLWRVGAFMGAAMLAGLSGALYAHQLGFVSSDAMNLDRSLALLIVVVIGGLGHAYGPLLGALFLVGMNQAVADLYSYANFIFGTLLLTVMVFMPHGLSGLLSLGKPGKAKLGLKQRLIDVTSPLNTPPPSNTAPSSVAELELAGVSKSYAGVRALQDVSMTIVTGTVHALIGPNGAGKSTLINVISGLYRADAGSIRLRGDDVTGWAAHRRARRGLARTFQNLQLIGGLTVVENVMLAISDKTPPLRSFGHWILGRPHEENSRQEALRLLSSLHIGALADASPNDLSYGHKKLAELARALAQNPTLLLLDEPIAGLNEEESHKIADGIKRLAAAGVTILLVEHDMTFVMSVADTITVLDYGKVIASGTPDVVRNNPAVIEAYLGAEVNS